MSLNQMEDPTFKFNQNLNTPKDFYKYNFQVKSMFYLNKKFLQEY